MSGDALYITTAKRADLAEVLGLLEASALPGDGVAEHLTGFFMMRDSTGRLVGCVGVERYGEFGLLRSVAVASDIQRSGIGSQLVTAALREARSAGIREIVLLTTTARDFFARRFGFRETTRETYEQQFAASAEWRLPRCSSAVVMRLNLHEEAIA